MRKLDLSIGNLATATVLLTSTGAIAESHLDATITGYECSASFAGIVQGLPCSGSSVSGQGSRSGDYVQIAATVRYAYHDDGLSIPALDSSQAAEYERGILSLNSSFVFTPNMCTPGKPCIFPVLSQFTSPPFVLGLNDMPDDLSGEVELVARYDMTSVFSGPFGAGGGLGVAINGVRAEAISAPVPEPTSYALMLAGLALLGIVAKRGASSQGTESRDV